MKLLRHLNFLGFQIGSQKLRVYYKEHLGFGEIDYVLNVHSIGIVSSQPGTQNIYRLRAGAVPPKQNPLLYI